MVACCAVDTVRHDICNSTQGVVLKLFSFLWLIGGIAYVVVVWSPIDGDRAYRRRPTPPRLPRLPRGLRAPK
jgi:hypothetical protein